VITKHLVGEPAVQLQQRASEILSNLACPTIYVFFNHLAGSLVIKTWDQEICFLYVVSDLSLVVANIMATRDLHDR